MLYPFDASFFSFFSFYWVMDGLVALSVFPTPSSSSVRLFGLTNEAPNDASIDRFIHTHIHTYVQTDASTTPYKEVAMKEGSKERTFNVRHAVDGADNRRRNTSGEGSLPPRRRKKANANTRERE